MLPKGSGHNWSGCHHKVIIPTPLNTLGCLKALDPKACADVMELYAGSPLLAATNHSSEMKAEVQET